MEAEEGCAILAESLKSQGVQYVFGIVGIPVVEVGLALQAAGVHYVGMRNEQSVRFSSLAISGVTVTVTLLGQLCCISHRILDWKVCCGIEGGPQTAPRVSQPSMHGTQSLLLENTKCIIF